MEIQRIELPAEERKLLFDFMDEDPGPTIDFNWLMPVVEKIETLFDIGIFYDGKREPDVHNVRVYAKRGGSETIVVAYGKSKIETTHKAVVEFIKWYNQQTK